VYALTERYMEKKRESSGRWHCPYCRAGWGYAEGENDRLRRELSESKTNAAREKAAHDQTREALKTSEEECQREKEKAARVKKRIAHGVCPCCHRTFRALARHMKTKHPEYAT
jgi:phage/plasmid primase-like uncharacterized protein